MKDEIELDFKDFKTFLIIGLNKRYNFIKVLENFKTLDQASNHYENTLKLYEDNMYKYVYDLISLYKIVHLFTQVKTVTFSTELFNFLNSNYLYPDKKYLIGS